MNKTEKFTSLKTRMCVEVIYNFVNLEASAQKTRENQQSVTRLSKKKILNTSEGWGRFMETLKIRKARQAWKFIIQS